MRPKAYVEIFYIVYFAFAVITIVLPLIAPDGVYTFYSVFFAPVLLIGWAIIAAFFLAASLKAMLARKASFGIVVTSALLTLVVVMVVDFDGTYQYVADWEHFMIMRSYYNAQVSRLPDNGLRFAEFNWGGVTFASRGVVYDESDQISLPPGHQSRQWIARMKGTDLLCGEDRFTTPVRPLGGHYYITGFGC